MGGQAEDSLGRTDIQNGGLDGRSIWCKSRRFPSHVSLAYQTPAEYAVTRRRQAVEIWTTPSGVPTSTPFDDGDEIKEDHQALVPALT